ncbi:HAD-IIIC family phosphatase [Paenibacillus sp. SYP-B4298]|uniref:HAD-IIIC family phosphatase n=1 Tax=Paenibacillus sp. SYP-B4298 TaxID=2996034 RepID=UPI0022DD9629|nr:HAD-IIIC family phosphatase [Paenibacillus sp. SYP-B4298]
MMSPQPFLTDHLTFMDLIDFRSSEQPHKTAFTFIEDDQELNISYRQLKERSSQLAAALRSYTRPGDKVLILHQPGADYVYSFFGCLYAGCTAVPAYPPLTKRYAERVRLIAADCHARVALVSERWSQRMNQTFCEESLLYLNTDPYINGAIEESELARQDGSELAFIQYTSGSTSKPKGVMVSHQNLIHNSEAIRQGFQLSEESTGVLWLPPYHDMGLIGGILQPIFTGFHMVLLAPNDFVQQPMRWLSAVSKYRATVSGGPNFAYDLCIQKIPPHELHTLDLSTWDVAFTGAEQIQAQVMRDFHAKFTACGFREQAFYSCYGLAESTLFVTGGIPGEGMMTLPVNREKLIEGFAEVEQTPLASTAEYVACGSSYQGQQLHIVHPQTGMPLEDGVIGEVWVSSASKALGYLNQPEQTAETFHATLGDGSPGEYVRTGDLGFLMQGRLFITGRVKEMIIIRGKNYFPADMEWHIEQANEHFIPDGCAAFSVSQQGNEQLVIVQELSRHYRLADTAPLANTIRSVLASQFGIQPYEIVFVKQGGLQKTSSGKKMRNACKEHYQSGLLRIIAGHRRAEDTLDVPDSSIHSVHSDRQRVEVAELAGMSQAEQLEGCIDYVRTHAAHRFRLSPSLIQLQSSLLEMGFDSISAVEFQYQVEVDLGIKLSLELLLSAEATVESVAAAIVQRLGETSSPLKRQVVERMDGNAFPLSEDQQRLWFVEQLRPGQATLHIPVGVRIIGSLDPQRLYEGMLEYVQLHETLRTAIDTSDGGMRQYLTEGCCLENAWLYEDLEAHEAHDGISYEKVSQDIIGRPFDLANGPLFRCAVLRLSSQEHILLFVIHHLISDLKSAFLALYGILSHYHPSTTGASKDSSVRYMDFLQWRQHKQAEAEYTRQLHYWEDQLKDAPLLLELPPDYERPAVSRHMGGQYTFHLSSQLSERIRMFSQQQGVTPYVTLLSAYIAFVNLLTESRDFIIGTPVDGRRIRELEEAIGFYAQPLPLRIRLESEPVPFLQLLAIARQSVLQTLENQDISFSKIVEMVNPERTMSYNPVIQVMFSYLALGRPAGLPAEWKLHPQPLHTGVTEFDFFLTLIDHGDRMSAAIAFNTELFELSRVEAFADLYMEIIQASIASPEKSVREWELPRMAWLRHQQKQEPVPIQIVSTFTSQFVEDALAFWLKELGMRTTIGFAPYNQVFQQLLQPDSELARSKEGIRIVLVRLSDFRSNEDSSLGEGAEADECLLTNVHQLAAALEQHNRQAPGTCIVAICPEPPESQERKASLWSTLEGVIVERIASLPGVYLLHSHQLSAGLTHADYYDEYAEKMSHTPYTYPYFACIGTALARTISSVLTAPKKVMVLDCDYTLWSGVCAEDGAEGVVLDDRSLYLQHFVLEQHRHGMLICLCSKNAEHDVWRVLESREDMLLRKEHVAAYRMNWEAKSSNLASLAEELGLSLDSFIMLDDNPVECAEIEANCPDVFVIHVQERWPGFRSKLERLWVFDQAQLSEEDRRRNQMYRENALRQEFIQSLQQEHMSYESFMSQLQLEVNCTRLEPEQIPRISQLTYRTNQFNSTGLRQREEDLLQLLQHHEEHCLAVHVRDRFGDYGWVGAVFYQQQDAAMIVHGWMLSCRVLGKGVEARILEQLRQLATEGTQEMIIHYIPTDRNTPFHQFVRALPGVTEAQGDGAILYHVPLSAPPHYSKADYAASSDKHKQAPILLPQVRAARRAAVSSNRASSLLSRLESAEELVMAIQRSHSIRPFAASEGEYVGPRNQTEEIVAAIWRELLQLERISVHDSFFFIGGHSLLAHQVLYRIRDAFGIELSLDVLFQQDFTVAYVSSVIDQHLLEQTDLEELRMMAKELEGLSEEELLQLLHEHSDH